MTVPSIANRGTLGVRGSAASLQVASYAPRRGGARATPATHRVGSCHLSHGTFVTGTRRSRLPWDIR